MNKHKKIFDTIKDGFLSKERQFGKDKKKRDVMHQDNWTEKIEHCEKQTNVRDCGVSLAYSRKTC